MAKESNLRVFYGWAKLGKVRKKEAISVIFENQPNAGWHHRTATTLQKMQNTVIARFQTEDEAKDAAHSNRVFTEYSIFLEDKKIGGSLEEALRVNSESDRNNVSQQKRKEIAAELRRAYLQAHPHYKEPTRQLVLNFDL